MDCGAGDALAADVQVAFARCLRDEDGWVRYAGLVGLEQLGLAASEHAAVVAPVLADDRPFVAFTAISTLFYTAGTRNSIARHLARSHESSDLSDCDVLPRSTEEPRRWASALEALALKHPHPMVAWKAAETLHMITNGLGTSCGKGKQQPEQGRL